MDGLHQLTGVAIVLLAAAAQGKATAADFCSLVVRVQSPGGKRVTALVSVEEGSGRSVERGPALEDVRFCDLGIAPVTVKVGADGTCNQVIVRGVPLAWGEQYLLKVTYDLGPCLQDLPPPPVPVCRVLFRISDANGAWLNKASIRFQRPDLPVRETDDAGRAVLVLKSGDQVEGAVSSSGYASKPFSVSCSRSEPIQEEPIKLERPPRQ